LRALGHGGSEIATFPDIRDRLFMGKTLILTLLIVLVAVLLLGIRVFFVKGGKFPNTHIDANKELRDKGIHCASHEDTLSRRNHGI